MQKCRYLVALIALSAASVPAIAQSTSPSASGVQPADAPRSKLEKQQTEQNGQATKYGQPGSTATAQPAASDSKTKSTGASSHSETPKKTGDPAGMPSTPTSNNARPATAN